MLTRAQMIPCLEQGFRQQVLNAILDFAYSCKVQSSRAEADTVPTSRYRPLWLTSAC